MFADVYACMCRLCATCLSLSTVSAFVFLSFFVIVSIGHMNAHACIFMRMCEAQGKGDGEGENEGEVRER